MVNTITDRFSISSKGLSFLRISVALIWFFNLITRGATFNLHFTEGGLLPFGLAQLLSDNQDSLFLYGIFEHFPYQIVFVASFFCAFFLLIGYRTKYISFISFFLMLAIDSRNQFLLNAGYETCRVLMFWMIFLPIDRHYSYKDFYLKEKNLNIEYRSWFCVGLITQVTLFYLFGGILKDSLHWTSLGDAIEMAMANHFMAYPWANVISNWDPDWLKILTNIVIIIEFSVPILLLFTWHKIRLRKAVIVFLVSFHSLIFIFFKIGFLPILNIAAVIALWPFDSKNKINPHLPVIEWSALLMIFYLILINVNSIPGIQERVDQTIFKPSRTLLMDQSWMFFAPFPYAFDGWWSIEAVDKDDKKVQLRIDGNIMQVDPKDFYWNTVKMEEKTFLIHMLKPHFVDLRKHTLNWLCHNHKWNKSISTIHFIFYRITLPHRKGKLINRDDFTSKKIMSVSCF